MLIKYSLLAMAAVASANLNARQDTQKTITDAINEEVPPACRALCEPIFGDIVQCTNDLDTCLDTVCDQAKVDAIVDCQNCIAKEDPTYVQGDEEKIQSLTKSIEGGCEAARKPVKVKAIDTPTNTVRQTGASSTTANPSAITSTPASSSSAADASQTTNAAVNGATIGQGAVLAALGFVVAAI